MKKISALPMLFASKQTLAFFCTGLAFTNMTLAADATRINLNVISATGNPLGLDASQLATPVTVLNGRELSLRREGTIAETLNGIPGVSATGFGPNASRPIIRGLDGDRVRILQNGVGVLDASSLSFDHAVSIDPLIVEQIDVVRGPAALLYGGSAVGGVVNATDNRIPKQSINGVTGRYEARYGGADAQKNGVVVLDAGNGVLAIHADAYQRKTSDLAIPGFAISNRKAQADGTPQENRGRLVNSDASANGAALGVSATFDKGYAGVSYSRANNNYGTVLEPGVRIDMRNDRVDFASEVKDLGGLTGALINRVKVRLAYTDYMHQEIDAGEVASTFKNNGLEGALELGHAKIGNMQGVVGMQFQNATFTADSFVPKNTTVSQGIYVYEELPLTGLIDALKLSAGGRIDRVAIDAAGGGKFGAPNSKSYTPNSYALGGVYTLNSHWSLASNLSHNERAPSHFELLADGKHMAAGQYQIGDANLTLERSNGVDAQIRWKSGRDSLNLSAYYTQFSNFIGLLNTVGEKDGLPIAQFTAVPAVFKGLEMEGRFGIANNLVLTMRGDYVHATNSNTGAYLPRIAPLRLGAGLQYQLNNWTARVDALHALKQNRTAASELPTDGYTNVSALVAYNLPTKTHMELFLRATNLLNQEIRQHSSVLKEFSMAGERSIMLGLRGDF